MIQKHLDFKLSGQKLIPTSSTKYLGVILDQHLSYDKHISTLIPSLSRTVGLLAKIRHYVPLNTLRSIYFSLFHSKLIYGLQVWIHGENVLIRKVKTLQNKALRIIDFKNQQAHSSPLYKKLNILKLSDYAKLLNCLFVYDQLKNKLPKVFKDFIIPAKDSHPYDTRNIPNNIKVPTTQTISYGSRSVATQCALDWNQLQKSTNRIFSNLTRSQLKLSLLKYFNDSYI